MKACRPSASCALSLGGEVGCRREDGACVNWAGLLQTPRGSLQGSHFPRHWAGGGVGEGRGEAACDPWRDQRWMGRTVSTVVADLVFLCSALMFNEQHVC